MDIAAIVVAVVAGGVSLLSAVYTTRLASRLEEERHARTKAELLDELMDRYRDPLLQASFDLQSRIYNIAEQGFLARHYVAGTDATREYARENTLYVLAEYLGWVEILRREVRFMELGDEVANRDWATRLGAVRSTLQRDDDLPPCFRLFNGQQRAIGEIMVADGGERLEIIGYAKFLSSQQDPEFNRWFGHLREDIDVLAREPNGGHDERLRALQRVLIDLIDLLDPEAVRVQTSERRRLAAPPATARTPSS
jgi:hypothetical protein